MNTKPLDFEKLEAFLEDFPFMNTGFLTPKDFRLSKSPHEICEVECERYGSTWACPPAVGTVRECEEDEGLSPGDLLFQRC